MTATGLHQITTAPKRARCPKCKRMVLDGISDGMAYRADAIPLSITGEVAARLDGRSSYRLIAGRLFHRDQHDIANDARRGRPPVAATHSCTPVDPGHIDPTHIVAFMKLTADPTPEADESQQRDQESLFIISGRFAGARIITVPTEDLECPF